MIQGHMIRPNCSVKCVIQGHGAQKQAADMKLPHNNGRKWWNIPSKKKTAMQNLSADLKYHVAKMLGFTF